MTRASLLALAGALAACGRGEPPVALAAEPPPEPVVVAIAKGVPHGAQIVEVAITEAADAAATIDALEAVRLWPSLDGTRPPVPVDAIAPRSVAIAHAGQDLLVAILDEARTVTVLRLGLDGSLHSRVQLPATYEQVVALDGGVLARTPDQVIEWFAPDGTSRGRVVAAAGTRLRTLVVRNGGALAIVEDAKVDAKHSLRWLTLGVTLTWGATIPLPISVSVASDLFALSPNHRRVALLDQIGELHVYELDGWKRLGVVTRMGSTDGRRIGFLDDRRVVAVGSAISLWSETPTPDPWAVAATVISRPRHGHFVQGDAIGDGLVVSGYGASLVLADDQRLRYLGWDAFAPSNATAAGSQFVFEPQRNEPIWLDAQLALRRRTKLEPPQNHWMQTQPLDERHVVTQTTHTDGQQAIALVDLDKPESPVALGTYRDVGRIQYSPESRLLAVSRRGVVERFALDLETHTAKQLAPVKSRGHAVSVALVDPATAGGVTAIVVAWERDSDEHHTLTIHRERGKPTKIRPFTDSLLRVEADGTMFIHVRSAPSRIEVKRGHELVRTIELPEQARAVELAAGAQRMAYIDNHDVVMLDGNGAEVWRKPLWGASQVLFTPDARRLVVHASGGFVAVDAATGVRVATECGWEFGIHTTAPHQTSLGATTVCEDPMLQ